MLEHCSGDFAISWPLAALLPGMGLIFLQPVGVGLHNVAALEKKQAGLLRRYARNKGFGSRFEF